jgi:hypothetical protein
MKRELHRSYHSLLYLLSSVAQMFQERISEIEKRNIFSKLIYIYLVLSDVRRVICSPPLSRRTTVPLYAKQLQEVATQKMNVVDGWKQAAPVFVFCSLTLLLAEVLDGVDDLVAIE